MMSISPSQHGSCYHKNNDEYVYKPVAANIILNLIGDGYLLSLWGVIGV